MKKISILILITVSTISTVLSASELETKNYAINTDVSSKNTVDSTRGWYEDTYGINDQHNCDMRWAKNTYTSYDSSHNLHTQYVSYSSDSPYHNTVSKSVKNGTALVDQNVQHKGTITFRDS